MKKYPALALIFSLVAVCASAQEQNDKVTINNSGDYVSAKDGNLNLSVAGMMFSINNEGQAVPAMPSKSNSKVGFSIYGDSFGATKTDHIAFIELGVNTIANQSYDLYTPEEAAMLPFSRSSHYVALNPLTMSVALNKSRSLSFNMALGFAIENYKFAGKYSMKYDGGIMRPIELEGNIKKSKLIATYLHFPFLLNYNFSRKFFIAAGVNLDILMNSKLFFKKPRTSIDGEVTLNPVQVGATARIGWGKLYGFVNYSFMEMFKRDTGPGGNRLSAGIGLFF